MKKEAAHDWRATTLWELLDPARRGPVAVVGAGGKSALLAAMAREARQLRQPLLLSVTTKLAAAQVAMADRTLYLGPNLADSPPDRVAPAPGEVVLLARGALEDEAKVQGLPPELLDYIAAANRTIPLVVEADGAAGADLKLPGPGEPVIPGNSKTVVVVTGLHALGAPIEEVRMHREDRLASILPGRARLTPSSVATLLTNPQVAFKGTPPGARRIWLINKADSPEEQRRARRFAERTVAEMLSASPSPPPVPDLLLVGSLRDGTLAVRELMNYYVHRENTHGAL